MARQKATAQATTLCRLRHTDELKDAVKKKYRDNSAFVQESCTVKDRDALLIVGSIGGHEPAKWAARVKKFTGTAVEVSNETAAGVLLLRLDDQTDAATWALCWGMGWLLLDQGLVDGAFGQRLALRSADPDLLSSLTRTVLDERAKKEFRVRGADAVSVPLGLTPAALFADLKVLDDLLTQDPRPELQVLEQLVPVKKGTDLHERLETRLLHELREAPDTSKITVTWPHEHLNENKPAESFRIKRGGDTRPRAGLPTVEVVLALMSGRDIASLDRIKIQLFGDAEGEDAVSSDIPLRKWVALEIEEGGRRYFLHDGQWFAMDLEYAKQLDQRVKDIFAKPSGVTMPAWQVPDDEEAYNKKAADALGAVLMDRKLVQTAQNKRGFEPSDLVIDSDVYVHVESATSSAPLSHLFAQGANSAHSLLHRACGVRWRSRGRGSGHRASLDDIGSNRACVRSDVLPRRERPSCSVSADTSRLSVIAVGQASRGRRNHRSRPLFERREQLDQQRLEPRDRLGVVEVALDQQFGVPARREGRDVVLGQAPSDQRVIEAADEADSPPRYIPGRLVMTAAQFSGVIALIGVTMWSSLMAQTSWSLRGRRGRRHRGAVGRWPATGTCGRSPATRRTRRWV